MPDTFDNRLRKKPRWLEEQKDIEKLLHTVINKLDKNSEAKPGFTINKKNFPLLSKQGEKADAVWYLLKTLFNAPCPIFTLHKKRKRDINDPDYKDARIRFNPEAENTLRQWLNRPVKESELEQWRTLVEKNSLQFPGDTQRLSARKIAVKGKSAEEVINGFLEIKKLVESRSPLTLRNLSARCFWQDSKFLDAREELLKQLYPELNIKSRPVIINVYLPQAINGILFIENQDNYTRGINATPESLKNMALIYSAGFKLSAERIRSREDACFHYHGQINEDIKTQLSQWWHNNTENWPVFFWGDLDYSGMDILKKLKQRFSTIRAWQPGYQPMLEALLSGGGHTPEASGKQEQKDTGNTGCAYADEALLPALRASQRFIDQEWLYE
ncbi:hypothetical protein MNBD_GAMMA09-3374 [hydrothermal vent metagenome]|uniref:Wadjet protein JetD C-terminal domain-containing protein n=1 Tax=hydrothermal vent metagenome TaxID=652676 RepID=A0A3B0XZM6_9ZZZZ